MLSSGRDEDGELTGCGLGAGFCADVSPPASDPVGSLAGKVGRFHARHRLHLHLRHWNLIQTGFSRFWMLRFLFPGGHFGPRAGRAALQQETQKPGSGGAACSSGRALTHV